MMAEYRRLLRRVALPRLVLVVICLLVGTTCNRQSRPLPKPRQPARVTYLAVGDIFLHLPNVEAACVESLGTYDFRPMFERVRPMIESADFASCWLGGSFADEPPYTGYPIFRSPDQLLWALKDVGFDIALATNHIMDGGRSGLLRRIRLLDSLGLRHPGEFASQESSEKITILEAKGVRLALLSYTYGTNGLPIPEPYMVNLIDQQKMKTDIEKARSLKPDFLIVALHQGTEYQRQPNAEQLATAKFLAEQGVDAVISSHPHVIEPAGIVKAKLADGQDRRMPVLSYSLGNFLCAQYFPYTQAGLMVRLEIEKDTLGKTRLKSANYTPSWILRRKTSQGWFFRVLPMEQTLADHAAGKDSLLTRSEAETLLKEWRSVLGLVDDPTIPFRLR